jgi:hypothetical protein
MGRDFLRLFSGEGTNSYPMLPVYALGDKGKASAIGRPFRCMIVVEETGIFFRMQNERCNSACQRIERPEAGSRKALPIFEIEPFRSLERDLPVIRRPGQRIPALVAIEMRTVRPIRAVHLRFQQSERAL